MTPSTDPVPTELADLVLAIDGVRDVYPPRAMLARIPGIIASAVTQVPVRKEIGSTVENGRTTLTARIATSVTDSSLDTAQRVADLLLASVPTSDVAVDVRIERIC